MMKYSVAKLFVSVILVVSYFALPRVGFMCSGPLSDHVLYPLSHANIWHLLANIVCLWMIPCRLHLGMTYLVAVACSFLPCFLGEPTSGFSGVLFAVVGMSWGRVGRFKDMLLKNKWFLILPLLVPHVNGLLHIYCLLLGYICGRCYNITPHANGDCL